MKIAERRNTYSYKWDVADDVLPMWVADMDFEVSDEIKDAIRKRIDIGAYGYSDVPDSFYKAYIAFFKDIHGVIFEKDWFIFSTGVVPSISSIVRKLTKEGDKVCVLSPCYNIFYNSIVNNNRIINECNLSYEDTYTIDFKNLEEKIKESKLLIFCNPHNPTGNVWTKEELTRVVELCNKYDCYMISDEIHCDIMTPGKSYNPVYSLDIDLSRVIMLASASKCFNMAGLQASVAIVKDKDLRFKVWRGINTDECGENNFFAAAAHEAALNNSRYWLIDMNSYVYQNKLYLYDFIEKNIPEFKISKSDALYLVWINIKSLTLDSEKFTKYLLDEYKLFISSGEAYGNNGKGFIRLNLATSLDNVKECCERLLKASKTFMKI